MLISFFALIISFGVNIKLPDSPGLHDDFVKYIRYVEEFSAGNIKGIPNINYGKTNYLTIAYCYLNPIKPLRFIVVNKNQWQYMTFHDKVITMAHELAHCYNDIDHKDDLRFKDGCAKHFMNPVDTGSICNKKYFNLYLKQMRTI